MKITGERDRLTFREGVAGLPRAERDRFDRLCEQAEEQLLSPGSDLASILAQAPADGPVRELFLVHVGRCWLEGRTAAGQGAGVGQFLAACGGMDKSSWVAEQLQPAGLPKPSHAGVTEPAGPGTFSLSAPQVEEATLLDFQLPPHYELEKEFPPSGMGLVFLVTNRRQGLDRKEVLKTIKPKYIADPDLLRRFRDEAPKLTRINHPGVVTVYTADEHQGWPYYTMEYLEGGSLADRLRSGPLPAAQAAAYFAQLARALHCIHTEAGFAHRDIKPHNMVFARGSGPEEIIKLTDFGLAKQVTPGPGTVTFSTAQDSVPMGTAGYIAPEQLSEAFRPADIPPKELALRSDLFALGASFYQCLTGRLPYQTTPRGADLLGPVVNPLEPPSRFVPHLDAALEAICLKALRQQPKERHASAAEFAQALESWLQRKDAEPTIPAPDPQAKLASWVTFLTRHPIYFIPLALAVMAFGIWLCGPSMNDSGPPQQLEKKKDYRVKLPGSDLKKESRSPAAPSGFTAELVGQGWPETQAAQIERLNQNWFQTLNRSKKTAPWVQRCTTLLGQIALKSPSWEDLKDHPHLAPLLVYEETPNTLVQEFSHNPAKNQELTNLFLRYPTPETVARLAQVLPRKRQALLRLQKDGWLGAEAVLLAKSGQPGVEDYQNWIADVLDNCIGADNERGAEFMALVMIHGPHIHCRLTQEADFRKTFVAGAWPGFKTVALKSGGKMENLLADPAIWQVLSEPGGDDLIANFGLAPVALFHGRDAYPKELHSRLRFLLGDRNQVVVQSMVDPVLCRDDNFRRLLGKKISPKVLALAIDRAQSKGGQETLTELRNLASWTEERLTRELEADRGPSGIEKLLPQGIYVVVAIKLLSGESVYDDEWERLLYRGVRDVAVALSAGYLGASETFVQGFDQGYWAVVQGAQDAKDLKRKRRQQELQRTLTDEDRAQLFSVAGYSHSYIEALDQVRTLTAQRIMKTDLQLNPVLKFFRAQIKPSIFELKLPDLDETQFAALKNGWMTVRFAPEGRFAKEYPEIAGFFADRCQRLAKAGSELTTAEEQARRELVSAWWLLNALEKAPLSDR